MIKDQWVKNNLHHAYLIEGDKTEIIPEILDLVKGEEIVEIILDSFKIEDTRNLKSYVAQKPFADTKKIYIIAVNNILLEAQQAMLKIFEEPIPDTHFFLILPDKNILLKTLLSRFYVIQKDNSLSKQGPALNQEAKKFIKMTGTAKINFLKDLLEEEDAENLALESPRSKALNFLNDLESELYMSRGTLDTSVYEQIFKVRELLRMPGSSVKTLMESIALMI